MTDQQAFSLDQFELYVHRRKYELAARELLKLLNMLDAQYGAWGDIGTRPSNDRSQDRRDRHVIARTTAAIGALFADPDFRISLDGWGRSLFYHRWLQILFGACDFANADHVLHLMKADGSAPDQMTYDDPALIKFSLLYSGDSQIPLQMDAIWNKNPQFAAGLFMAILSNRVVISDAAMQKKEALLEWLPEKIKDIELTDAHLPFLHDVWMHCSYAFTPKKHDIKVALNHIFRKRLLAAGCQDADLSEKRKKRKKPVMVIPLEWFTSKHAMYRCFSPAIKKLRDKFHLIALATPIVIDDVSKKIFHEVIEVGRDVPLLSLVKNMSDKIIEKQPDIIFYPSVGMQLSVVALSNLRLAPIQCMGLGHPATSHSHAIDYVLTPKGNVGDARCFHEKMILVDNYSMPATPPENVTRIAPNIRKSPDTIKIAITASVMKINSVFLKICRHISDKCERDVEFCFFVGHGIGITRHYMTNAIQQYLPNATVYPHTDYDSYITNLNQCDVFLVPVPFGNTNGNVDTTRQGIPGVCMDGAEVHSHIDAEYFSRFGFPDWVTTKSHSEYIDAAVRLIHDDKLRVQLGKQLLDMDIDSILFDGNTDAFLKTLSWIYDSHEKLKESDQRLFDADDYI